MREWPARWSSSHEHTRYAIWRQADCWQAIDSLVPKPYAHSKGVTNHSTNQPLANSDTPTALQQPGVPLFHASNLHPCTGSTVAHRTIPVARNEYQYSWYFPLDKTIRPWHYTCTEETQRKLYTVSIGLTANTTTGAFHIGHRGTIADATALAHEWVAARDTITSVDLYDDCTPMGTPVLATITRVPPAPAPAPVAPLTPADRKYIARMPIKEARAALHDAIIELHNANRECSAAFNACLDATCNCQAPRLAYWRSDVTFLVAQINAYRTRIYGKA